MYHCAVRFFVRVFKFPQVIVDLCCQGDLTDAVQVCRQGIAVNGAVLPYNSLQQKRMKVKSFLKKTVDKMFLLGYTSKTSGNMFDR